MCRVLFPPVPTIPAISSWGETITAAGGQQITVFPTAEAGWAALEHQIDLIVSGQSKAGYTPDMSIAEVGQIYSGGSSNWAANVASVLGTTPEASFAEQAGAAGGEPCPPILRTWRQQMKPWMPPSFPPGCPGRSGRRQSITCSPSLQLSVKVTGGTMNNFTNNPKTTFLGVLMILGALVHAATQYTNSQAVDLPTLFAGISGGIGLLAAKDSSTHSTAAEVTQATQEAKKG